MLNRDSRPFGKLGLLLNCHARSLSLTGWLFVEAIPLKWNARDLPDLASEGVR
jgi:hypothetical protein